MVAGLVVGYCASAIGGFTFFVAFLTYPRGGPGFYMLGLGEGAEVLALVIGAGLLLRGVSGLRHASTRSLRLGICSALLVLATSMMNLERFSGEPLWFFRLFPGLWVLAAMAGFAVLAVVPLFALTVARGAAVSMVLALAASQTLGAADAALDRLSQPHFAQLTVGFWLTVLAVLTLVFLAFALGRPEQSTVDLPVPAALS